MAVEPARASEHRGSAPIRFLGAFRSREYQLSPEAIELTIIEPGPVNADREGNTGEDSPVDHDV